MAIAQNLTVAPAPPLAVMIGHASLLMSTHGPCLSQPADFALAPSACGSFTPGSVGVSVVLVPPLVVTAAAVAVMAAPARASAAVTCAVAAALAGVALGCLGRHGAADHHGECRGDGDGERGDVLVRASDPSAVVPGARWC
ncbi:hypothetical protein [Clavibacter tessellarius]|uniref:hypothetical protein n=1 Tax=Clavibacter tessellarius TaxID=31965 RepID=UPI001041C204|nr:hypothetical protein [Clavibacter michiganensis]